MSELLVWCGWHICFPASQAPALHDAMSLFKDGQRNLRIMFIIIIICIFMGLFPRCVVCIGTSRAHTYIYTHILTKIRRTSFNSVHMCVCPRVRLAYARAIPKAASRLTCVFANGMTFFVAQRRAYLMISSRRQHLNVISPAKLIRMHQ